MGAGSLRYWAERLVGYWSLGHWSGTRVGELHGDTTGFAGRELVVFVLVFAGFECVLIVCAQYINCTFCTQQRVF